MAVIESRPYRVAPPSSVRYEISAIEPDADLDSLAHVWVPGQDMVIRASFVLDDGFWTSTGLPKGEPVRAVCRVSCLPARWSGRAQAEITHAGGAYFADVDVPVAGSVIADVLTVDLWVSGRGRRFSVAPSEAVHEGAKLWAIPRPVSVDLQDDRSAFPTSVVSFRGSERPAVPWVVDVQVDSEPEWSIDLAIRLVVNLDFPTAAEITQGTAPEHIYQLIQADIRCAAVERLAMHADEYSEDEIRDLASSTPNSLGALAHTSIIAMGLDYREALTMATERPTVLAAFARASALFYRERSVTT